MRHPRLVLVLALLVSGPPGTLAAGSTQAADAWAPRPPAYGVALEPDVRITMSDGVRLTADVLRPADGAGRPVAGRFPVVLTQTPYNKKPGAVQSGDRSGLVSYRSDYLVERGYVQVVVEVRGTGSSEGVLDPLSRREHLDGAELVEWVASQERPWSDGRVALHGSSYAAINQIFTAAAGQPALRAIFPVTPTADMYRDLNMIGGQVQSTFIPQWFTLVTALGLLPPTYTAADPVGAARSFGDHGTGAAGSARLMTSTSLGGEETFDGPLWWEKASVGVVDRVRAPAFLVGGWYDLAQRGTPILFERLAASGVPARLVAGPWGHWQIVGHGSGGYRLRVEGHTLEEWELRWFDHHVRGEPDPGLEAMAPVTYCPIGEARCQEAAGWPPPDASYRQLFLGGPDGPGRAGTLTAAPPDAPQDPDVLLSHQGSGGCSRSWTQFGWTSYSGVGGPCDNDQRVNDRTGVVYDLPLEEDLVLAGPMAARLFVDTNGRDGFLATRVEDVAPDGRVTQLSAGGLVLSLRALDPGRSLVVDGLPVRPYHPFTRESVLPVRAGEVYELWVEIFPAAARIPAGHTLRLAVQPSDWPHLSPSVRQGQASTGGVLRLHHDHLHPAALVVPVEP